MRQPLSMLLSMLVGLTGGIACGKTTVARLMTQKGALVVDADQVARDVVQPGSAGLLSVEKAFGHWVLTVDGFLDRPALSEHIFSHPQDRQVLEGILHPLIAEESQAQITNALQSNAPLVVYDAALLFESGRAEAFRPIIVVSTSVDIQIQRLMERDELTRNDAHKRIDAQMPVREKAQQADFVIHNDGSLSALQDAVNDLWKTLCP